MIKNYLEKDANVQDAKDIDEIAKYFSYPLNYYGKTLNSEKEFITNYEYHLLGSNNRKITIDSILIDKTNPNLCTAYGSIIDDKKNTLGNTVRRKREIKDQIEVVNNKIVKIIKIK